MPLTEQYKELLKEQGYREQLSCEIERIVTAIGIHSHIEISSSLFVEKMDTVINLANCAKDIWRELEAIGMPILKK